MTDAARTIGGVSLEIATLTPVAVQAHQAALVALFRDAVDSGASIGFLPPVADAEAAQYWDSVATAVGEDSRVVLAAHDEDLGLVGSGQLELAMRANASHRAKVMVHRRARRRGVGRALMLALEEHARRLGRTTLILDTRQGDPSEGLYRSVGWTFACAIPRDATALYLKLLDPAG